MHALPPTRGLTPVRGKTQNAGMTRNNYKWDGDSRDERPSEFAHSGYPSTTAGVFHSTWSQERVLRRRRSRFSTVLRPLLVALAVSGLALYVFVTHLRG